MWVLKRINDGVTKYLISENKTFTVGRKNCDVTLEDDASISRKHSTLYIAKQKKCPVPVSIITEVWLVDENSKYGTYLKYNNDWIRLYANEKKKLTSGSIIKFGLMGNIWSLEYKPVVACASGIPSEQKRNVERSLQSIDGILRNSWCKECSVVIVNEITLTLKVVLALINGVPITTQNYIQEFVEAVKNQTPLPNYEEYRPVIKESILDKTLVSLDTKNHRKELFKGIKFVVPSKKQLEILNEVITSAGGSYELLSLTNNLEKFAEDNVVVLQLPVNKSGIPEDVCKLVHKTSAFLKNKCGRRIVPESEIAQAIAYSSTEKYCNPKCTCFNLKIGERKQFDLGHVIVEETPIRPDDSIFEFGVVPSSETMPTNSSLNSTVQSQSTVKKTEESQKIECVSQNHSTERKRIHSPNQADHEFQRKKPRSRTTSDDYDDDDNQAAKDSQSFKNDNVQFSNKTEEKSNLDKANQTKPPDITDFFQKQNKPPLEKPAQLTRQTSSSFWDIDSSSSKSSKRKISIESDDSIENYSSSKKKPKLPDVKVLKKNTPELHIDTPREVVQVLNDSVNSGDCIQFPPTRKVVDEEDNGTGYFGKDLMDAADFQMDDLNNTIFSLTIISPAFIKEDGTLVDPPTVPVNVKRFRKQKILSSAILSSLTEQDDELSDGEWIEPHSNRLNISVAEGSDY